MEFQPLEQGCQLMRKKIFIGVFLAAVASIVAGDYVFNRSGAQDAPKKAAAEEKKDASPLTVPPLPTQPAKDGPPTFPSITPKDGPPTFPTLPANPTTTPPLTTPPSTPAKTPETKPANVDIPPAPVVGRTTPSNVPQIAPPPVVSTPTPPTEPQTAPPPIEPTKPPVIEASKADPNPPQELVFPQVAKDKPGQSIPPLAKPKNSPTNPDDKVGVPKIDDVKPDIGTPNWNPPGAPTPPIAQEVAKIKDCPWSLQIDMVDGQTTVIATVNKKHEFKIVCKSLDLQTAKGTLKASGKVTIRGDAFNGTCENLSIPLMEDRLVLEGGAAVTIEKVAGTVSNAKPTAFELKGETLNLRISELHREPFQQTSMRTAIDVAVKQASATTPIADKQWTPYGTLRRVNTRLADNTGVWQLEDRTGKVIVTVLARVGGTLTQHEGQTISVIGATEVIDGQRYLRVTHIALP
jgi:hypothetical protein